jgi:hypothetical protein
MTVRKEEMCSAEAGRDSQGLLKYSVVSSSIEVELCLLGFEAAARNTTSLAAQARKPT